jgi:replicative DNA helicase
MNTKANFVSAADVLDSLRDDLLTGRAPVLYPIGMGELSRIEVGPGLVNLIGGAPGAGKTAFTMQAVTDALRLTPSLRALVCNVEMPPGELLNRQLSRLSGVNLTTIRKRLLVDEHADRINQGINTLAALADRLCFLRPPFDLSNVAAAADAFGAELILLDYIQRIPPPGEHGDKRGSVDACMNYLRQFADAGVAVLVVSAVGRSKDKHGRNSYADGLSLASFRESSELEFGADSCFILAPHGPDKDTVTLKHLKDRYGELQDIHLRFDGAHQAFTPAELAAKPDTDRLTASLAALWNRTPAAPDEGDGDA